MGWASAAIERLVQGQPATIRPRGSSMTGRVEDRQVVIVAPYTETEPQVDDVVLCRVRGREYLHLVKAKQGGRYLIGNNRGGINGWIGRNGIFGRMTRGERTEL
jgi:hypothetical protein